MKIFLLVTSFFLLTALLPAQTIERIQEESLLDFASRVGPDSTELISEFTRETDWDGTQIILAFYQQEVDKAIQTRKGELDHITGYVFKPVSPFGYKAAVIGAILPEGGNPEIVAVFFANADGDSIDELAILVRWEQHDNVTGMRYGTLFYQRPNVFNLQNLTYLKEVSEKFDGCECWFKEDGRTEIAKFKTEEEVRGELVRMGYK